VKAGKGRDGRRDDESRVLPESQLRRLMELQGLNKVRSMIAHVVEFSQMTSASVVSWLNMLHHMSAAAGW
jgi:hypothetical protein